MNITIREEGGKLIATLEGRLDTVAAEQAGKDLAPLNNNTSHDIVIDCTKLEYISSSGLRIFLDVLQHAEETGGHVYIKGITDDVRNVFAITGFINLFEFK